MIRIIEQAFERLKSVVTGRPTANWLLPRYAIPLDDRVDLRGLLQATLEIVKISCPTGEKIVSALANRNTRVLVFTDTVMDKFAPEAQAFHATASGETFIGLKESSLRTPYQHFNLIRGIAHEVSHVLQQETWPCESWNHASPRYVDADLNREREAFANAAEVMMAIAIHEAQAEARVSGTPVTLQQTNMARAWFEHVPEEAAAVFQSVRVAVDSGGNIGTHVREAAIAYFDREHAADYRQSAITKHLAARSRRGFRAPSSQPRIS